MKIDKESRKMLDNLIGGTPDYPRKVFSYPHICEAFQIDEEDMFRIIKSLERRALVEYASWGGGDDMGILLTQEGKSYKELARLDAIERWGERLWGFIFGASLAVLTWFVIGLLTGELSAILSKNLQ